MAVQFLKKALFLIPSLLAAALAGHAQTRPMTESDYYRIVTLPVPENIQLEVGGLATLPNGQLAVSTRRGEVWIVSNPYLEGNGRPIFQRFAQGLHEPLGLMHYPVSGQGNGARFLVTQRGEVTELTDTDGDGVADAYNSFARWPLSGNYHQYSYGPVPLSDGSMIVTLNLDWIGKGASQSQWRGWMMKLDDRGNLTPWATGLRSPAGFGEVKGAIFYTENQGDWVGSGRMTHLDKGDFAGNPAGLRWSSEAGSPVKLRPEDIPDTGEPLYDVAQRTPGLKPPAVWFPHALMGISTSDFKEDTTGGAFGPFAGQVFVGDQGHSKIMRVAFEKVNGVWQGACFPFREGFESGLIRMVWGLDGSMFVGQTSRGWASTGKNAFGLQRLVWTGQTPFEIKTVSARPDGFELAFTLPVDPATAGDPAAYEINSFTYKYHHTYGSPVINTEAMAIKGIVVAADGLSARLVVDAATLRKGYIHEIKAEGLKSKAGLSLLHNTGYYTLNEIPAGPGANAAQFSASSTRAVSAAVVDHSAHASMPMAAALSAKRVTEQPAEWKNGPDQVITMGTKPGLKFDQAMIKVKAGSRIKLVFNNNDDMLHNLVVTNPGMANPMGEAALKLGLKGAEMNYVPNLPDVLYHTGIMQPESSETIYFVAPAKPGDYQYVCTFPGHYIIMQGVMKVVK